MAGQPVAEEGRAAVLPSQRQRADPRRRRRAVLRQGANQVRRLVRRAVRRQRHPRGAAGGRPPRQLHRPQHRAHAVLRQHRRLCRRRHHGRHLGHRRLLRADRQERASVRWRRHRRRAGTAAGQPDHHRGQLLHRRALRSGRGRDHRRRLGAVHGRVHRPVHADLRPRDRRDQLRPRARRLGGGAGLAAARQRPLQPDLRGHRQEGRCPDPQQDQHQRPAPSRRLSRSPDFHRGHARMSLPEHRMTHLKQLEAESIHIIREVAAEFDNPVMLYSIGKDSSVMLHLARKAFAPGKPPFPLMHVNTTWKFREMISFRDRMAKEAGMELLSHTNPEGLAANINPFDHGSSKYTDIMKTQALKQALDKYGFDAAFGGARRDEEKSRAKERVYSFRDKFHRWDPKNQRPELWNLYNGRINKGESIRVFPLSNWTELDIWQYIYLENIEIVPLYFSDVRPVVERDGMLIMVDDERLPLKPGEVPMMKSVRFRTLGCYPLTGAVESGAATLPEIIQEMLVTRTSERSGRAIDHDESGSMEKKKREGYF
ncbi:UNVERIFIED_CONTAM: cysD1 [Trichonephila clavipes]